MGWPAAGAQRCIRAQGLSPIARAWRPGPASEASRSDSLETKIDRDADDGTQIETDDQHQITPAPAEPPVGIVSPDQRLDRGREPDFEPEHQGVGQGQE